MRFKDVKNKETFELGGNKFIALSVDTGTSRGARLYTAPKDGEVFVFPNNIEVTTQNR